MFTRVLPWMLAGGFAIATAVLLLRGPAPQAQPAPGPAAAPVAAAPVAVAPRVPDLAPLRQCRSRLEAAQTLISRCEGAPAAAAVESSAEAAEELIAARDSRRAVVRASVEQFLGATPDESKWVMEYVCAVRGLRADVIADLRSGKLDLAQAAARQKAEREDTLADLEEFLGNERYQKLRSVGGLGKLGDLFEC